MAKPLSANPKTAAENELLKELQSTSLATVGAYSLGKDLGEGSFGKVKLAVHQLTNQLVAVKIVEKFNAPIVVREIEVWRHLRHPNIVQLYEIVVTESKIYMVMEYVSGGEIFDYIHKNGPLPDEQAARVFHQLVQAIKYCHDKQVVHRDLKLENVLFDHRQNVKLIDFGFTTRIDTYSNHRGSISHSPQKQANNNNRSAPSHSRLLDTYCGSAAYAAPEMIAGTKYSGVLADIWSLGVILYTLLCGHLPFDADVETVVHAKILKAEYEWPKEYLERLNGEHDDTGKDLVERILIIEPDKRLSTDDILQHPWILKHVFPVSNNMTTTQSNNAESIPETPLSSSSISEIAANALPASEHLLHQMIMHHLGFLGFNLQLIERSVAENRCDTSAGLYYLVKARLTGMQQPDSIDPTMAAFVEASTPKQSCSSMLSFSSAVTSPRGDLNVSDEHIAMLAAQVLAATSATNQNALGKPVAEDSPLAENADEVKSASLEAVSPTKQILNPEEELLIRNMNAIWSLRTARSLTQQKSHNHFRNSSDSTVLQLGVLFTGRKASTSSMNPDEVLNQPLLNRRRSLQLQSQMSSTQSSPTGPHVKNMLFANVLANSEPLSSSDPTLATSVQANGHSRRVSFAKAMPATKISTTQQQSSDINSASSNQQPHDFLSTSAPATAVPNLPAANSRRKSVRPATAHEQRRVIQEEPEDA